MLLRNQIYEELIEEVGRLEGKKVSDSGLRKIISEIVDGEEENKLKKFIEDGKINDKELCVLLKIIGVMEISETWEEFKKLRQKKKKQKQDVELTDFDKVLAAMLKVPKPNKEKKPPK